MRQDGLQATGRSEAPMCGGLTRTHILRNLLVTELDAFRGFDDSSEQLSGNMVSILSRLACSKAQVQEGKCIA